MPVAQPANEIDEVESADLLEAFLRIRQDFWLIAGIVAGSLCLGLVYWLFWPPTFEADALIQVVQEKSPLTGIEDLSNLLGTVQKSSTEVEVIQSRSVLRKAVEKLHLDVTVRPRRLPLGAAAMVRLLGGASSPAWLGLDSFAWGDEHVQIDQFSVPEDLEGRNFTLIAGDQGLYSLRYPDGQELFTGTVGRIAQIGKDDESAASLLVAQLQARPGTEFLLQRENTDDVVADLQKRLLIAERNKQTGIIKVAMKGMQPRHTADIVNAIIDAYIQQNIEQHSEEASRMLKFLDSQLPQVKQQLDVSESALRELRSESGTPVEVNVAGQELIKQEADVAKTLSELQMQRSELSQRFADQSDAMETIRKKIDTLSRQRDALGAQLRSLPGTEWKSVKLVRDAKVASEVYTLMLNRSQELQVSRAGIVGSARILDPAIVPRNPIWPKASYVLGGALIFGLLSGFGVSGIRRGIRRSISAPEEAEKIAGAPAFAVIVHSPSQAKLGGSEKDKRSGRPESSRILCVDKPNELSVECMRSLRAGLPFAMIDARNNVIALHGPTPSIGKTFISTNLGVLLADAGKSSIIIDCDLRKGDVHWVFGVPRNPGVSEIITGQCTLEEAIQKFSVAGSHFITSGKLPPNPAEILSAPRFAQLIEACSKRFDYVILDSPPILYLADSVSIGNLAGTNLMVVRCNSTTTDELRLASDRMEKAGIRISGLVVNDLQPRKSTASYGTYYSYRYRSGEKVS